MISPQCAMCDVPITKDNDTQEHIIPRAIGGKKKVKGFICKNCNSESGSRWESILANQLNPLNLFFGISRQGNKVPSQLFETTGGDKLKLNADGSMDIEKPTWSGSPSESGGIQIRGRGIADVEQMLKKVKKEYPEVDVTEALKKAKRETSYRADMIKTELSFGGPSAGRSIVKSALALAVESGIPAKFCVEAINYLKNEESEACFGYFYKRDLIMNRPDGIPLHCVSIKGCEKTSK